jgi:hypothetical protein
LILQVGANVEIAEKLGGFDQQRRSEVYSYDFQHRNTTTFVNGSYQSTSGTGQGETHCPKRFLGFFLKQSLVFLGVLTRWQGVLTMFTKIFSSLPALDESRDAHYRGGTGNQVEKTLCDYDCHIFSTKE